MEFAYLAQEFSLLYLLTQVNLSDSIIPLMPFYKKTLLEIKEFWVADQL